MGNSMEQNITVTEKAAQSKPAINKTRVRVANTLAIASMTVLASPAFAQISKVNSVMTAVQTTLTGVSVAAFTVAIIWAGFKMAWSGAKWADVSNIVFGGILVGGASGIASWVLTS